MEGQSHRDPKTSQFYVLKILAEDKKSSEGKINNETTSFWRGRKEPDIWMKKYHFTHVPCPLLRAIKNCAPHGHFDERFPLRTLARWHSISLLLMQVGIAHRTLWAAEEQQCCAPPCFPHGSWWVGVKGLSRREESCGHAAHMGPWSSQGRMLMEYLIPQDLAVGKSSLTDPSYNKPCRSRKPHSSTSPRGLIYIKWPHRVLS